MASGGPPELARTSAPEANASTSYPASVTMKVTSSLIAGSSSTTQIIFLSTMVSHFTVVTAEPEERLVTIKLKANLEAQLPIRSQKSVNSQRPSAADIRA